MKDFSQFNSWLQSQENSQIASVIRAAIDKGVTMNGFITSIPSSYNNAYQSIRLYHYDQQGQFVDDTRQTDEAIADSVIDSAKATLEGYSNYFKDTKSGVELNGVVYGKRGSFSIDKFIIANANNDWIQPNVLGAASSFKMGFSATITTSPSISTSPQPAFMVELNLGRGFSLLMQMAANGRDTVTVGLSHCYGFYCGDIKFGSFVQGYPSTYPADGTQQTFNTPSASSSSVPVNNLPMISATWDGTHWQCSRPTVQIAYSNGGIAQVTLDSSLLESPDAFFSSIVGAEQPAVRDSQDLIEFLANSFMSPDDAIQNLP